ncbi:hypothetical protein PENSPDRAFT_737412 [Peniophora sp. CONT]|nr:hypothetical protein PENSPDRAFT_737412 [Peniophora sp. CONT]
MSNRNFRLGAAFAHHNTRAVEPRADSCSSGGFYLSPAANQVIDASSSFNISWDKSCISTDYVDIYLYEPSAASSIIHVWGKVYNEYGTYSTTLSPSWWNGTSSAQLYLNILASGTQPFQSNLPAGPVFNASVSDTSAASSSTDTASFTQVNNGPDASTGSKGVSKGGIAAAVILPLLAIAGLVAFAYIRIKRGVEKEKRRRFSVAVDSRMSTINPDWASITPAGAAAGIRNSMAVDNRASSFSYGGVRPMSTASAMVDGGQAGIGARGLGGIGIGGTQAIQHQDEMRQVVGNGRTVGTGLRNPASTTSALLAERVSRVSFAPDTRPSMDSVSRKSVASRAFHTAIVPPLPTRNDSGSDGLSSGTMSPTQTQGALPLSTDDIRARINEAPVRPSMDEMMPALRMMRSNDAEDFPSPTTTNTTASHVTQYGAPVSPPAIPPNSAGASSMSSFMPMAAASMSPDDMLRAYAGRRVASPPPAAAGVTQPMPTYTGLYPATSTFGAGDEEMMRKSMAPTEGSRYSHYTGEDVYGGTM